MSQTPFVETELLLAALNDDDGEILRIAQGMFPNERRSLHATMSSLLQTLDSFCVACDQVIPEGQDTPRSECRVYSASWNPAGAYHARCFPKSGRT